MSSSCSLSHSTEVVISLENSAETRTIRTSRPKMSSLAVSQFRNCRSAVSASSGILAIHVDQTIGADHCLLAIAVRLHGAHDLSGLAIDGRDIVRAVIVREHPFGSGIIVDTIRSFADVYFLDELQGGWVEH